MTGKQNIVFFLGMGLLVTAFWFGGQFSSLWGTIKGGPGGSGGGGSSGNLGTGGAPPGKGCPPLWVWNPKAKKCIPGPRAK
jgi:hypothetical protein